MEKGPIMSHNPQYLQSHSRTSDHLWRLSATSPGGSWISWEVKDIQNGREPPKVPKAGIHGTDVKSVT